MPTQNIHVVSEVGTLEEVYESLAKLQKTMKYLINGNLDFENIRAKSITADRMDVNELSAITANLGHIIAGLIESVEIYGSYIATARGTYPRAEMSNTEDLFGAYKDAFNSIKMHANLLGSPTLVIDSDGEIHSLLGSVAGNSILFQIMKGSLVLRSFSNLNLRSSVGYVDVESWNDFLNASTSRTLQQDLNAKANAFSGYSGSFNTGTKTVIVSNGVITSVV